MPVRWAKTAELSAEVAQFHHSCAIKTATLENRIEYHEPYNDE
jgi:hypothetical protein